METSTRLVIAAGCALVIGALAFILMGEGIAYFGNLLNDPSGVEFGSSLTDIGYAIIVTLLIIVISVVGYLVYRHNQSNSGIWSGL